MPSELLERLNQWYDETPAADVMRGRLNWRRGLGRRMDRVDNVVIHLTAGWPRRSRISVFTDRYTWTSGCDNCCDVVLPPGETDRRCGIGPQFFITYDGTTARYLDFHDFPRAANHASWVNSWSLGVETGNLLRVGRPSRAATWQAASADENDIPGAKLWITGGGEEVLPGWWTTTSYTGPKRGRVAPETMLFSEWQYRAWAALARYLAEQFRLPRNFPLLPHAVREDLNTDSVKFRRMILADERAEVLLRMFAANPIDIPEDHFEERNAAALQARYAALALPRTADTWAQNPAYNRFFQGNNARPLRNRVPGFRGIHGHGFSGAIDRDADPKVDCPGPLFDFFRLAREVWDWWWYPFDADAGRTDVPLRGYRNWNGDTPLLEYYWDESEAARAERRVEGIHGPRSSPATFRLEPGSPVYALANGELVAARFPTEAQGVSGAFVLVRHEVFHLQRPAIAGQPPQPGEIDFDQLPSYVYSLYYHLGRPAGLAFDAVNDGNPDWLNRVLIRKKECDLGVAFYQRPNHGGIADASWESRPPGDPERPTTLEGWENDQTALGTLLADLSAGRVAVVQRGPSLQPIRIILGDFLGASGVIRRQDGVDSHGVRVEVFSPSFSPPGFHQADATDWSPPPGSAPPHSLRYVSEWARVTPVDPLQAIGVVPEHTTWWWYVVPGLQADGLLPAEAKLPVSGDVFHFDPLEFMRWINEVTWRHEWPKYEVTDASGNAVPIEDAAGNLRRPRSRRI